jgi:hypothetical protein
MSHSRFSRRARGLYAIERLETRRLLTLNGAQLFTTAALTTPGLVGSYVNQSLQTYAPQDDWRSTQAIAGSRTDPAIEFPTSSFGPRAPVGITGGTDADWDNFSVQWDGYLKVIAANTRFATKSDDGSRMWIDLNNDGIFNNSGPEFINNNWGAGQGDTTGDRSVPLAAGAYKIRIQYYESGGGNSMALVSSPLAPKNMPVTATNPKQVVKVLVLDYDPRVPSQQNKLLHDVMGWSDPRALAAGYEQDLEWASGGAVDFQVVDWRDLDQMPIFADGFRYNPDNYVQLYRSGGPWHTGAGGGADFYTIAQEQHLADLVNSGAVDELWTFGGPFMGINAESFMAGPNSFFINGPSFPDLPVDHAIAGYSFNYERGIAEMIHDNGHRTENHMARAYNGAWNFSTPTTLWDKFAADYGQASAGPYGIGNTHFPANGNADYDYGDTRIVSSTALDWQNYPNLTGATTPVSRDNWGWGANASDYQRDYLDWFFSLVPRANGTSADGRQNNWWKYIYDFNSYEPNTGLPRQEDAFASGGSITATGGTTWTFTVRYYDVTGVNVNTLDNADVRVTGPNGFSVLATRGAIGAQVSTTSGTARTVTYQIPAPGGSWDGLDAGTYSISLVASQVSDTLGNFFPAGQVGSFHVDIPDSSRIDVNAIVAAGHATITGTTIDIGPLSNMFDGSTSTIIRTPNINPATFQVAFDSQQSFRGFRLYFQGGQSQWTIETADTQADLDGKTGTYRLAVPVTITPADQYSVVALATTVSAKIVRLTAKRLVGDGYVHIAEWQMLGSTSSDVVPPSASVPLAGVTAPGGTSYFLPVTFTDASAVSIPSLKNGNLRITGPNGFDVPASFYDVDNYLNGPTRLAQYYFVPAGGVWDSADNGVYTVTLQPAQVADTLGNTSPSALVLGTITVNIPPPVRRPTYDLTENNAAQWSAWAQDATATTSDDASFKLLGNSSVKFVTTGGFDTYLSFPPAFGADWDLSSAHNLYFSVYAQNPSSSGFQQDSPLIRLRDPNGGYFEFSYYQGGGQYQLLNDARGVWKSYTVPLNASATQTNGWRRTIVGNPRMDHIASLEFHADTWDFGFTLWYDRVGFDIPISLTSASLTNPAGPGEALAFNFDENVGASLADGDLQLKNILTNALVPAHADHDPTGKIGAFTFPTQPGQLLPSGLYHAVIPAGAVADPANNPNAVPFMLDLAIVNDGDTLTLPPGHQTYVVQQAFISGDGRLDLSDNNLVISYTGQSPEATIQQYVRNGLSSQNDRGLIASSGSDATFSRSGRTLAVFDNHDAHLPSLNGTALSPDYNQVLVKYTYYGDANVDGRVDPTDYAIVDGNQGKGHNWVTGDLNFDGKVDPTDYAQIDGNQGAGYEGGGGPRLAMIQPPAPSDPPRRVDRKAAAASLLSRSSPWGLLTNPPQARSSRLDDLLGTANPDGFLFSDRPILD